MPKRSKAGTTNGPKGSRFAQYFAPVQGALKSLGGSGRPSEVKDYVLKNSPGLGGTRFSNDVDWARFYLVKYGFMSGSRRGVWSLTEAGTDATLTPAVAAEIVRQVPSRFGGRATDGAGSSEAGDSGAAADAPEPEAPITVSPNVVDLKSDQNPAKHVAPRLPGVSGRIQSVLERKGQVILHGPPGTGKTHWAEKTACDLAAYAAFGQPYEKLGPEQQQRVTGTGGRNDGWVRVCCFHPAYGYEDFLEGYRPVTAKGSMTFRLCDGVFKQLCADAAEERDQPFYLIIDEINRGDIPRIFGELMTVMEKSKRGKSITLPISGRPFRVPANVFVIGTMNTADRSIALLDTALRRRFGFVELMPDKEVLRDAVVHGIPLGLLLDELNQRIRAHVGRDARNLQMGHTYFLIGEEPVKEFSCLAQILREDVIPLLEEYCYEDYAALARILGDRLVDKERQLIRDYLFDPSREQDLVRALLSIGASQPEPGADAYEFGKDAEDLEASRDDDTASGGSGA